MVDGSLVSSFGESSADIGLYRSLALVMEGMDVGLVNNFFGQPGYKAKFGNVMTEKGPVISANWQAAINNGQQAGAIIGLLFNGWAQSRFGSRRIYMLGQVLMVATSERERVCVDSVADP